MLTIGFNTVAVYRNSQQSFKIFDSHSRDLHGMPHSFGKCTLLSIEGLENLVSYLQLSCLQTGVVPFEIKGVLISDSQPDVEHVHENHKQKRLSSSNQSTCNPKEPVTCKLQRKCSGEIYEVKKKRLIVRREYEKNRSLNESPENREKRLACQREYKRKKCATESAQCRQKRLASKCEYQKDKRANESSESRANRLADKPGEIYELKIWLIAPRKCEKKRRLNESLENRKQRLARQRECNRKKCANESAQCRQKRLASKREYQKEKRTNESSECRAKRLIGRDRQS